MGNLSRASGRHGVGTMDVPAAHPLVVDDEASVVRAMLLEHLARHGHAVRTAAGGAAMRAELAASGRASCCRTCAWRARPGRRQALEPPRAAGAGQERAARHAGATGHGRARGRLSLQA
jgi:hypothetical protein